MLFTYTVIVTILLSVSVHELGHAYAMRQCGVRIAKIGLLGIPGLGTFRLPIRSRFFLGTHWYVHPLLIGAYVEPNTDDMEKLVRKDALYVYGMGPLANVLFSLVVMFALGTMTLTFDVAVFAPETIQKWGAPGLLIALGIVVAATWYFRRILCQLMLLPVGWLLAIFIAYLTWKSGPQISGISDIIGDIHRARPVMMKALPASALNEITMAVKLGAGFSVLLGLVNLLPLVPLDGGHMTRHLFPSRWQSAYEYASTPIFALLMLLQFGKDALNLGHWLWSLL